MSIFTLIYIYPIFTLCLNDVGFQFMFQNRFDPIIESSVLFMKFNAVWLWRLEGLKRHKELFTCEGCLLLIKHRQIKVDQYLSLGTVRLLRLWGQSVVV